MHNNENLVLYSFMIVYNLDFVLYMAQTNHYGQPVMTV